MCALGMHYECVCVCVCVYLCYWWSLWWQGVLFDKKFFSLWFLCLCYYMSWQAHVCAPFNLLSCVVIVYCAFNCLSEYVSLFFTSLTAPSATVNSIIIITIASCAILRVHLSPLSDSLLSTTNKKFYIYWFNGRVLHILRGNRTHSIMALIQTSS